jgi:hypothetical protein
MYCLVIGPLLMVGEARLPFLLIWHYWPGWEIPLVDWCLVWYWCVEWGGEEWEQGGGFDSKEEWEGHAHSLTDPGDSFLEVQDWKEGREMFWSMVTSMLESVVMSLVVLPLYLLLGVFDCVASIQSLLFIWEGMVGWYWMRRECGELGTCDLLWSTVCCLCDSGCWKLN